MLTFTKHKPKKADKPMVLKDRGLLYSAERALELIELKSKKIGKRFNETHNISGFWMFPYGVDFRDIFSMYMNSKISHQELIATYPSERGYRMYMVSFDSYRLTGHVLFRPFQMIYLRSKMRVEFSIGPEREPDLSIDK